MYKPTAYLGGSISGILFEDVLRRQRDWTGYLEGLGFEVVDPIADEVIEVDMQGRADMPVEKAGIPVTPEMTARMDLEQVDKCDIAIFLLDAETISRGSIAEEGFAYANGLDIFVLRSKAGVHDHGFINGLATFVTDDATALQLELMYWYNNWASYHYGEEE